MNRPLKSIGAVAVGAPLLVCVLACSKPPHHESHSAPPVSRSYTPPPSHVSPAPTVSKPTKPCVTPTPVHHTAAPSTPTHTSKKPVPPITVTSTTAAPPVTVTAKSPAVPSEGIGTGIAVVAKAPAPVRSNRVSSTAAAPASPALAQTGADTKILGIIGGLLVAVGSLVGFAGRRRP